jgi:glycosyltransferase involved in cell wall biosynthesis
MQTEDHNSISPGESHRLLVSVILAVLNEAAYIEQVIHSLLRQACPTFDLEILVVDGNSTDGTSDILKNIAHSHPAVRLLHNPQRMTPYAFNIGLDHARGEYVCIFGAHTKYNPDYIATCLAEMREHNATGCGGRVLTMPANSSLQARLVAAALGSAFGTSTKSFRNHREGYADTINYPVYLRAALVDIGGYDEQLFRNQDNDLNQRLRARGNCLYLTWKTSCQYFVQPTLALLLRYAWKTGYWNVISLKKNASAHGIYHFVPAIFVLACFLTSLFALFEVYLPLSHWVWAGLPLIVLLGTYFTAAFLASAATVVRQRWLGGVILPLVFLALHTSYGLGILWGLMCNATSPMTPLRETALKQSNQTQTPQ